MMNRRIHRLGANKKMAKPKQMISTEHVDYVLELLHKDEYKEANAVVKAFGFEGITSDFFEKIIAQEGLHMGIVKAIAIYYDNDENLLEAIQKVRDQKEAKQ